MTKRQASRVLAMATLLFSVAGCVTPPPLDLRTLHVTNVDGPQVEVQVGEAHPTRVDCSKSIELPNPDAPSSLHVVVRATATGVVVLNKTIASNSREFGTSTVEARQVGVLVRSRTAFLGLWPTSSGPRSQGCPPA